MAKAGPHDTPMPTAVDAERRDDAATLPKATIDAGHNDAGATGAVDAGPPAYVVPLCDGETGWQPGDCQRLTYLGQGLGYCNRFEPCAPR